MKLRPWHLGAALLASVTLHFGAIALTVDTSEEPALLQGGGGAVSMLGEAYTDMLTSGDPDTANAVAAESPDTLAPVAPAKKPSAAAWIVAPDRAWPVSQSRPARMRISMAPPIALPVAAPTPASEPAEIPRPALPTTPLPAAAAPDAAAAGHPAHRGRE